MKHSFALVVTCLFAASVQAAEPINSGIAFQPHQSATRDKRGPGGLKAFVSPDGIH